MRKVDPTGRNWATEIHWRHRDYTVCIDTVRSGGRNIIYNVFDRSEKHVGEAQSLRAAAELIEEDRVAREPVAPNLKATRTR